jgi:hypothetical protein
VKVNKELRTGKEHLHKTCYCGTGVEVRVTTTSSELPCCIQLLDPISLMLDPSTSPWVSHTWGVLSLRVYYLLSGNLIGGADRRSGRTGNAKVYFNKVSFDLSC